MTKRVWILKSIRNKPAVVDQPQIIRYSVATWPWCEDLGKLHNIRSTINVRTCIETLMSWTSTLRSVFFNEMMGSSSLKFYEPASRGGARGARGRCLGIACSNLGICASVYSSCDCKNDNFFRRCPLERGKHARTSNLRQTHPVRSQGRCKHRHLKNVTKPNVKIF